MTELKPKPGADDAWWAAAVAGDDLPEDRGPELENAPGGRIGAPPGQCERDQPWQKSSEFSTCSKPSCEEGNGHSAPSTPSSPATPLPPWQRDRVLELRNDARSDAEAAQGHSEEGRNVAPASGSSSLDTEGPTQRVGPEDLHNSTEARRDQNESRFDATPERPKKSVRARLDGQASNPEKAVPDSVRGDDENSTEADVASLRELEPGGQIVLPGQPAQLSFGRAPYDPSAPTPASESAPEGSSANSGRSLDRQLKLFGGWRQLWLDGCERLTGPHRERRARKLEERGKQIGLERRTEYRRSGLAARNERGGLRDGEKWDSAWHVSRARSKRAVFRRVEACKDEGGSSIVLHCRDCGAKHAITIGCDQRFFCVGCRKRRALREQLKTQARLQGLMTAAARAGLTEDDRRSRRFRKARGLDRFGLKLLTLTQPQEGTLEQRLFTSAAAWQRFTRLLRDELRPRLERAPTGAELDGRALSQWDFFHYERVGEWTPGEDGQGHSHLHALVFAPYLDLEWLRALWVRAYTDVTGRVPACVPDPKTGELRPFLSVDIRAVHSVEDGAREICKYLVKDWEITPDGSRPVPPETYARLYAALDGTRLRQSSAGLSKFALKKLVVTRCCGYESERGSPYRVEIMHPLNEHANGSRAPGLEFAALPRDGPYEPSAEEICWDRIAEHWQRTPEARALSDHMDRVLGKESP